jgi:hypothetical protein
MRRAPGNARLLLCPYTPPALRKGDHTRCLYRDADVVITSWSDGSVRSQMRTSSAKPFSLAKR